MKKLVSIAILVILSLLVLSCSSSKSVYQETAEVVTDEFVSGYFDKHLKSNEYEVVYKGNKMNKKKVFDLSMLRASEITKQKGFENFVVLSSVDEVINFKKYNIKSNQLKIAMYNSVPTKYGTFYNAVEEYNRLSKKYGIK